MCSPNELFCPGQQFGVILVALKFVTVKTTRKTIIPCVSQFVFLSVYTSVEIRRVPWFFLLTGVDPGRNKDLLYSGA
jgi:hypothetical protein